MKKMRWVLLGMLVAGSVQARGLMLDETALTPELRRSLTSEIDAAKKRDAEAFSIVSGLPKYAVHADSRKRGRLAVLTPSLKPLGARAVLPLIELLAFQASEVSGMPESARLALEIGAIEALGSLRDPRAAPVLTAIVVSPATGERVLRSAAEALGKQETDAAIATLVSLRDAGGARREAALAGFGSCRRLASAQILAEELARATSPSDRQTLARMLGRVANAWAWETGKVGLAEEQAPLRELVARALIRAHLAAVDEETKEATAKALLVADVPTTPSLLIEARQGVSNDGLARLNTLGQRFDRSPVRARR